MADLGASKSATARRAQPGPKPLEAHIARVRQARPGHHRLLDREALVTINGSCGVQSGPCGTTRNPPAWPAFPRRPAPPRPPKQRPPEDSTPATTALTFPRANRTPKPAGPNRAARGHQRHDAKRHVQRAPAWKTASSSATSQHQDPDPNWTISGSSTSVDDGCTSCWTCCPTPPRAGASPNFRPRPVTSKGSPFGPYRGAVGRG